MDEEEIKKKLTPEQYKVLREKGTEAPYSGKYVKPTGEKGMFSCVVCGNQLFATDAQFETNVAGLRGWPSFDEALPGAIKFEHDESYGMNRTEVLCAKCGSHLGHVFEVDEGRPAKGGQASKHYCINSVCLDLEKK